LFIHQIINRFSFKRVPRSVADTEPLLTVTFSTRLNRTDFEADSEGEHFEAPYNLSASEQNSLSAQVEKTFCWTGVRQIRLIRFVNGYQKQKNQVAASGLLPSQQSQNPESMRITARARRRYEYFTVQLVLKETADDGADDGALKVITPPQEFKLSAHDLEPPGLIQQLTEQLGLVHTTEPKVHEVCGRRYTFNDHVFSVQ
jgi:hypothetical protein